MKNPKIPENFDELMKIEILDHKKDVEMNKNKHFTKAKIQISNLSNFLENNK